MIDRNKTGITHDVTVAVAGWMEEHGFKPVETEVLVEMGWCADLAGVIEPTQTELIALKLLERPPSWNEINSLVTKRRVWKEEVLQKWQEKYQSLSRVMTCLVEVKTSRSDFNGDRKWKAVLPTDLAYVAVPKGLIEQREWPEGWGVLEFSNGLLRRLRAPTPGTTTADQKLSVVMSIAVRRDHHTRYERWREYQKADRIEAAENKQIRSVGQMARAMLHIAHGLHDSVEMVLSYHGIKNMPEYMMTPLRQLYGIAKDRSKEKE